MSQIALLIYMVAQVLLAIWAIRNLRRQARERRATTQPPAQGKE